jgi:hypothetical protein
MKNEVFLKRLRQLSSAVILRTPGQLAVIGCKARKSRAAGLARYSISLYLADVIDHG